MQFRENKENWLRADSGRILKAGQHVYSDAWRNRLQEAERAEVQELRRLPPETPSRAQELHCWGQSSSGS